MLKKIIFNGQLPYFNFIKTILKIVPLGALAIFIKPELFKDFGVWGWWLLLFIVFLRPISDILPKLGILKTLTILRKELGIISGALMLAHGIGFFLKKDMPIITSLFNPKFWDLKGALSWGLIGFFLTLIIILTSNKIAIKILKRFWKPVQRLTYLLVLTAGIHIILVNSEKKLATILILIALVIVWLLANRKIQIWK